MKHWLEMLWDDTDEMEEVREQPSLEARVSDALIGVRWYQEKLC